jgi:hypothetical protein
MGAQLIQSRSRIFYFVFNLEGREHLSSMDTYSGPGCPNRVILLLTTYTDSDLQGADFIRVVFIFF